MLPNPPNIVSEEQNDDAMYVSPTSEDTVQECYQKVSTQERLIPPSEMADRLHNQHSLFDDDPQ